MRPTVSCRLLGLNTLHRGGSPCAWSGNPSLAAALRTGGGPCIL